MWSTVSGMQTLVDALLADFHRDPRAALDRRLPKHDRDGQRLDRETLFSPCDLRRGRHQACRDTLREALIRLDRGLLVRLEDLRQPPHTPAGRAAQVVDHLEHRGLAGMDAADLRSARIAATPWSGDYWPVYLGGLGQRYADPRYPLATDWKKNHEYVQKHPAREILASGDPAAIDRLSPAEKYDLLVGDLNMGLTARAWAEGQQDHERDGGVATWPGIGHGWAAAASQVPRPRHPVQVVAADGRPLRLFPADIKALASLLWARATVVSRFTGGRGEDTDPGTFHLALVNQLGVARRSLIIDATRDHEIWNQPVFAYRYDLFNPRTRRHAATLADARTSLDALDHDPFAARRGPCSAALVGVMMELGYVRAAIPTHAADSPARDQIRSVRYLYDLELDADDEIVGGAWYTRNHPDLLWTPAASARARTPADAHVTGAWPRDAPVPAAWRALAGRATSESGCPLAAIVEALLERARG